MEKFTLANGMSFAVNHCNGGALPVLFNLCSYAEEALDDPWYGRIAKLAGDNHFRCVSFDLPFHYNGMYTDNISPILQWRRELAAGHDIFADIIAQAAAVLDHLIETGLVDPQRIAAFGTSRGGFSALHWAAADSRVKYIMALAPLIRFASLREFDFSEENALMCNLSLLNHTIRLVDRRIWGWIGNDDDRVNTDFTIDFFRKLVADAKKHRIFPDFELHIGSSSGHTSPLDAHDQAAAWLFKAMCSG